MNDQHPDFNRNDLKIGEKYGYAMTITTAEAAQAYLQELVQYNMRMSGKSEAEARSTELGNIGYFAGYYDSETMDRVYRLFDTTHPIFGLVTPTSQQAFETGKRLAGQ